MKLSLLSNVLLASMMVFAVSCGKDAKKKNNNPYHNYYNPYVTQVPTAQGATAIANLNSYVDAIESNNSLIGPVNVVKQRYSCETKDFLGINFLPYEKCTYTQVQNQVYAQPGVARSAMNPILATILTPSNGYTLGNVIQYGNVIKVDHVLQGATIETIQYTVELNRHAVSNPTIMKDTAAKRIDTVISPTI